MVNSTVINYPILLILALSSLNVYGIILSGWSSGTKYAYLGGLRSASQMISYEVSIGLTILPLIYIVQSYRLVDFITVHAFAAQTIWMALPLFIIMFISLLAETNRAPFDLPEAEAELVAGYNVEYSATAFALFFLAEYSNMILAATLLAILFMSYSIFVIKIIAITFIFVLVRATYPRYRYNQLMHIGWQTFLPLALALFCFTVCVV